ncbi:carboxymuconolactone decarboxylase family protein [Brucella cytisi]|uniref:carboxymuconolactone decarboxylase family protein n=1 Tax=Brucella cytisi TaxID=407152 RepID=UPI0035D61F50
MFPNIRYALLATAGVVAMLGMIASTARAQTLEERRERGAEVIRVLNNGATQPNLERMRQEFPFLADATEAYALGDVWSRPGLDNRTRQLAAVAAFAAMGHTDMMKVHAGYALNVGVPQEELKEVIYMVTVPAGFPRAIAASQALSQLFAERAEAAGQSPTKETR